MWPMHRPTFNTVKNKQSILPDVLEWDIHNWSHAIDFWKQSQCKLQYSKVLDLGSRRGGLSLLFANSGAQVICSDLNGPAPEAEALHRKYGVDDRVSYLALNAMAIDLPDESVDIVCFKSILGGIGRDDNYPAQQQTVAEILRVLKPGGSLFFAENLVASRLHQTLRRRFLPWGAAWRYLQFSEVSDLLGGFAEISIDTWGFFSAFGRTEGQRNALSAIDRLFCPFIPQSKRYIAFGYARKARDF
jgi:SAM-dependent methyltransferase